MHAERTAVTRALLALSLAGASVASAQGQPAKQADRARVAFAGALPRLDGRGLKVTLVEVTDAPLTAPAP